ncbi:MAG: non-canonical purine NTP pyrophosphatase [Acidobacteriaceae bacterium]|nr:non-canonical purine NTP pyrophosphatase [Acidobacteriaceae bacterium]
MHLYAATTNPGKLRDFARAAEGSASIRIEALPSLASIPAPPEDEPTFEGNARLKAVYYSLRAPGLLVLADDSGLEVDALDGAPGVRSARFAADLAAANAAQATPFPAPHDDPDHRNNAALLASLAGVAEERRQARYRCVLALARDGQVLLTAEGSVEGIILSAPRGAGGFGYDPLFLVPQLGHTMAELPAADRLALNHRGRALKALLAQLAAQ